MMYRALLASLSIGLVLAASSACTTTNSTNSAAGDATDGGPTEIGDGGIGDDSSSGPLTCFGIFQCAADCSGTGCEASARRTTSRIAAPTRLTSSPRAVR